MKTRAELIAMTDQELETYEQSLLAQWTPRMALENQIDRLSTERKGQLEIFRKLKNPNAPENSRLKDSIFSLKYKIEDLKNKLDDLV
jgi:predicted RNase H-like nuclease (RuvC/YqgF family)